MCPLPGKPYPLSVHRSDRLGVRNRTRARTLLAHVCKHPTGFPRRDTDAFAPTVLVRGQRAEQVLISTVAEFFQHSVSIRALRGVNRQFGGEGVIANSSGLAGKPLGRKFGAWRTRKLDGHSYSAPAIDAD